MFPVWRSLAIGTIAIVSRRMGEGRPAEAADATRQSLVLGAIAGLVFGVGFVFFSADLLRLLGASEEVVAIGAPVLTVVGGANGAATVWLIGTSAMRAAGETRTPMFLTTAGALISVALALVFIDVLGLGPMGSAYASAIGWILGMLAMLAILWRGVAGLSIAGGPWRLTRETIGSIFSISLPSGLESATFSFGMLALIGLGQPAQAAIFTLGGALRGAGDTRYPLVVSLVNWFLIRLPLAYVLAFPLGFGLTGLWAGVAADYFVRAGLLAYRFNSGAWQRVRV